jgi:HEAT repeat protein
VLWTLAKLGEVAAPFVIVRTADENAVVRAWATRLLGEIPTQEGARAVVRRVLDGDPEVRRAALAAGRMLQSHAEPRRALREGLCEIARDTSKSDDARAITIEALEDVREARAVPDLIPLIDDKKRPVLTSAYHALVVLTRQDFGTDTGAWQRWWSEQGKRHRIEWLIDSLMHDVSDIRRAAGDELKSLTKEYFGYYDDLPKKERARAQARYREWWESKGKARFR